MRKNFTKSFELVIGHEGGFQKDRYDRGNWTTGVVGQGTNKGTKYGITAMSYPDLDIRNLTLDQSKAIYLEDYWNACACDELPDGVDHQVFDSSVNHGVRRAKLLLQASLGVTEDGIIGPNTRKAIKEADRNDFLTEFAVQRQLFYTDIETWERYDLGWTRRCFRVFREALGIAGLLDESKAEPEGDSEEDQHETLFGFKRVGT